MRDWDGKDWMKLAGLVAVLALSIHWGNVAGERNRCFEDTYEAADPDVLISDIERYCAAQHPRFLLG